MPDATVPSFPLPTRSCFLPEPNWGTAEINALNSLSETEKDDVLNRRGQIDVGPKLSAAVILAVQQGKQLFIPSGLWMVNTERAAFNVVVPPNSALKIRGVGPSSVDAGTVLRRMPVSAGFGTQIPIMGIAPNADSALWVENVEFDGNEANFPYDPAKPFQWEHCANLKYSGSADPPVRGLRLTGVSMTGCVADGLNLNAAFHCLEVRGCRSHGRTRRTRSDIAFSLMPIGYAVIDDFTGDNLEFEPKRVAPAGGVWMNNIRLRGGLDLAGVDSNNQPKQLVMASNITCLNTLGVGVTIVNFFKLTGKFRGIDLRGGPILIKKCSLDFEDGRITVKGGPEDDPGSCVHGAIRIHNKQKENHVNFRNIHFAADTGITKGAYLSSNSAATKFSTTTTRFENCLVETLLDHFACVNRNGVVTISGGKVGGSVALLQFGPGDTGYVTAVEIENPHDFIGAALLDLTPFGRLQGSAKLKIRGKLPRLDGPAILNPELIYPVRPDVRSGIMWDVELLMSSTKYPVGKLAGIPGLCVQLVNADPVPIFRYQPADLAQSDHAGFKDYLVT